MRETTEGRGPSPLTVTTSSMGDGRRRTDRLAPLVHELLSWDFVRLTEDGTFELCEDVQQRLRRAATVHHASAPSVFVGRPCEACGAVGRLTRLIEGRRLCASCQSPDARTPVAVEQPAPAERHGHWGWRRRLAG